MMDEDDIFALDVEDVEELRAPRNPRNPRLHPGHHERGEKRWEFTYTDIARAAGVSKETVKKAKVDGRLNPANIGSVAEWIVAARDRAARRTR
jgi:hypothetical protein